MRVLQIGTDRTIFDSNSASASRMRAYGKRFGGLDIIVFSLIKHGVQDTNLSEHVRVHATNSFFRFMYVWGAVWLSFKLPKPDVVSVQDPFETGIAGWLIARLRGSALHVQLHTDFLSPEFSRLSLLNRLRVQIAGFVLRRASRIRVVSERIKRSLKTKNYKLKTEPTVLPIFVDVEKYRNAQVSPKLAAHEHLFRTKLLVVSRLEPEKNVGLAIHAFAKAALENSCLIIIGEGREGEKLHQMAIQRGVSKWVFFEGQTDPAQYYKIADLLLAPSRYEGYGMVVVEALAAGTPVISTDVGVAREAGAIIAEEDDFAKAITNWFANGSSTGESADFVARPAATTGGSSTDAATTGGPKEGKLLNYPYKNFEEYVKAYCKDIESST
ncbi:MAG: glycosyltransferase [bacterium]|nr:glycosyltransferase [bacterium]